MARSPSGPRARTARQLGRLLHRSHHRLEAQGRRRHVRGLAEHRPAGAQRAGEGERHLPRLHGRADQWRLRHAAGVLRQPARLLHEGRRDRGDDRAVRLGTERQRRLHDVQERVRRRREEQVGLHRRPGRHAGGHGRGPEEAGLRSRGGSPRPRPHGARTAPYGRPSRSRTRQAPICSWYRRSCCSCCSSRCRSATRCGSASARCGSPGSVWGPVPARRSGQGWRTTPERCPTANSCTARCACSATAASWCR